MTRPTLACLDGSKALRRTVLDVFDAPVIQRCQLHKIRNVRDRLPQRLRPGVERRMRAAYHADSALEAEALLTALARELDKTHPSAAVSLREALDETLTVLRLGVPPTLARTLRSTNAIESMISICATARATSSTGKTVRWRCAGALPAWSRPGNSSAASTATCTYQHSAPRSNAKSPKLSDPSCKMTSETSHDRSGRHRSSTELGTSSWKAR